MVRLKKILKELGITQTEFADLIKVNKGRLSLICTGKSEPRPNEIPKIEKGILTTIEPLLEKEIHNGF